MTAFLVFIPHPKHKVEAQIWHFDPNKALRKRTDIIKCHPIPDEFAEKYSIDTIVNIYAEVEKTYGSKFTS